MNPFISGKIALWALASWAVSAESPVGRWKTMDDATGKAKSIRELATQIKRLSGFKGKIVWDTSKSDGSLNKVLDVSRMKKSLCWDPSTRLENGLRETMSEVEETKPAVLPQDQKKV